MKPTSHVPRPSSSSSSVGGATAPKVYDLNHVPRPQPRANPTSTLPSPMSSNPLSHRPEMEAQQSYNQAVAVPRKNDPATLAAPPPVPAAASASMRIKLPDPPLTAEEYYAKAGASPSARESSSAGAKVDALAAMPRPSKQAGGVGYSQKVAVPRKSDARMEVSGAVPAPASGSMSIKLPPPPVSAEEYYRAAAQGGAARESGDVEMKMEQDRAARGAKAAKFPSLKGRYAVRGGREEEEQQVEAPSALAARRGEDSNALAQKAVSTIGEVASDIASGFGAVRAIHIHINAPVEVHIHQAKMGSKL